MDSRCKKVGTVTWGQSVHFAVLLPHLAAITIEVKTQNSARTVGHTQGSPIESIGKVTKSLASLLESPGRIEEFDADLNSSGCKLVNCCVKLWMIGPKETSYVEKPAATWSEHY